MMELTAISSSVVSAFGCACCLIYWTCANNMYIRILMHVVNVYTVKCSMYNLIIVALWMYIIKSTSLMHSWYYASPEDMLRQCCSPDSFCNYYEIL